MLRNQQSKAILVPVNIDLTSDRLYTACEVASLLRVPTKRIYTLDIPSIRVARRTLRYRGDDIQQFLEARRQPSSPAQQIE